MPELTDSKDILIVDDNQHNLKLLGNFLIDEGYNVRIASNGQEAIESVELALPDLILLDIHMPVMNGYDVCEKLKADLSYCDIPIMFLSTAGETIDKAKAFKVGGSDYMVKPFELDEMKMRINVHLLANQVLFENRAGLKASFENSTVGKVHLNAQGQILAMNPHLYQLLSLTEKSVVGKDFTKILPQELSESIMTEVKNYKLGHRGKAPIEILGGKQRGQYIWYRVSFSHVDNPTKQELYLAIIIEDITQQKRAQEEMLLSREKIRNFAQRMEEVREQERAGIAREMHDELGQALTGLKIDLSSLLKNGSLHNSENANSIALMMQNIDSTIEVVRRISSELRPPILDDLGLEAALEWLTINFSQRTGLTYTLEIDCEELENSKSWDTAIFRIYQEALTNIARHSQASHFTLRVQIVGDMLHVEIIDNGVGIKQTEIEHTTSIGLLGMQERASYIKARLSIGQAETQGTRIVLYAPLAMRRKALNSDEAYT